MSAPGWTLDSWRSKPVKYQPPYEDKKALGESLERVRRLPPLVSPTEIDRLRAYLHEVAEGKRFLLQGGDCAERFQDCSSEPIEKKIKILLQMSLVLTWGARIPTLRIARMAGQFSKPRSSPTEVVDGSEIRPQLVSDYCGAARKSTMLDMRYAVKRIIDACLGTRRHFAAFQVAAPVKLFSRAETVHSFRGDNVNGYDPDNRVPDPERLVQGYFHSAATLNYARALLAGQFADLHDAGHWDLGFVQDEDLRAQYKDMVDHMLSALAFMRVAGVGDDQQTIKTVDLFSSHEGLHLEYESALTRGVSPAASGKSYTVDPLGPAVPGAKGGVDAGGAAAGGAEAAAAAYEEAKKEEAEAGDVGLPIDGASSGTGTGSGAAPAASVSSSASKAEGKDKKYYNLGAHFIWIGDRTRQLDHAHVEYFRGVANPIGIKVGPSMKPDDLVPLIEALWADPKATPGKIVLITRLGASKVHSLLPPLIRAVKASGLQPVWTCDPMHGNTTKAATHGLKTRNFDDIVSELRQTIEIHDAMGTRLGGVHFELTGENVTECTGGPQGLKESDLPRRYTTYCDPRLNYAQSMELAFLMARHLATTRKASSSDLTAVPLASAKPIGSWARAWSLSELPSGATAIAALEELRKEEEGEGKEKEAGAGTAASGGAAGKES